MTDLFQPGKMVALKVDDHRIHDAFLYVLRALREVVGEDPFRIIDLGDRISVQNPRVRLLIPYLVGNIDIWTNRGLHKDQLLSVFAGYYEKGVKYILFSEVQWMEDNGGPLRGRPQDCQAELEALRQSIPPDVSVLLLVPQRASFYVSGDGVSGWTMFADQVLTYPEGD